MKYILILITAFTLASFTVTDKHYITVTIGFQDLKKGTHVSYDISNDSETPKKVTVWMENVEGEVVMPKREEVVGEEAISGDFGTNKRYKKKDKWTFKIEIEGEDRIQSIPIIKFSKNFTLTKAISINE